MTFHFSTMVGMTDNIYLRGMNYNARISNLKLQFLMCLLT